MIVNRETQPQKILLTRSTTLNSVLKVLSYNKSDKMSQPSLEDYLTTQAKRLEQLRMATTFIQNKEDVKTELAAAKKEVSSLKNCLDSARTDLLTMRNQIKSMKDLSKQLVKLREKIDHMDSNVPPKLLRDYEDIQMNQSENLERISKEETPNGRNLGGELSDDVFEEDKENMVKNCKKILFHEPEIFPRIKLLEIGEFEGIPKYMIGRQSLDAVNQFVNSINQILKAKYSLMALGQNGARKRGELDLYMAFKRQENANDKGKARVYFFTADDYHRQTKTKLDKTKLNLLTVLRHCKRLREVRASKAIQYAVVSS